MLSWFRIPSLKRLTEWRQTRHNMSYGIVRHPCFLIHLPNSKLLGCYFPRRHEGIQTSRGARSGASIPKHDAVWTTSLIFYHSTWISLVWLTASHSMWVIMPTLTCHGSGYQVPPMTESSSFMVIKQWCLKPLLVLIVLGQSNSRLPD